MLDVDIQTAGYAGHQSVLDHVRFSIQKGEQVGLIGPNGAGKSTTIKAVLGLLNDRQGSVTWTQPDTHYVYVPESPVFYNELTFWEHLSLAQAAFSLPKQAFEKRVTDLLQIFSMTGKQHHLLDSFSKGMQQKAMLIIALAIQPDLYIIDEPFIGLDPLATNLLLQQLDEERQRGAAVLMSTHVLQTAEDICDHFLLMIEGQLIADGNLQMVRQQAGLTSGSLNDCFVSLTKDVYT